MTNTTTAELAKALRRCATGEGKGCADCNVTMTHNKKTGWILGCAESLQLQAADRLEALGNELSKLKAQQRWIPVTEPPPKQEHVWIYYKNWAGKWVCNVGWWSGDVWYHHDETPGPYGWGIAHEVPTHWMPLPNPPKEDAHEPDRERQGN